MLQPIRPVAVPVTKYEYNGRTYDTAQEAEQARNRHAEDLDPVLKFSRSWSGKRLLERIGLEHVGTYLIKDEGPVDYGSSGSARLLKVVHGTLRNAILDAFQTKGFVGYGPGQIELVEVIEV